MKSLPKRRLLTVKWEDACASEERIGLFDEFPCAVQQHSGLEHEYLPGVRVVLVMGVGEDDADMPYAIPWGCILEIVDEESGETVYEKSGRDCARPVQCLGE